MILLSLRVQALASGSNGNSFVIDSAEGALLVDAGISRKKILNGLRAINISPQRIKGILVTHAHSDHIKGIPILSQYLDAPVFATEDTISELYKLDYKDERWIDIAYNTNSITKGKITKINPFKIITMTTEHDSPGAVAYRINHPESRVTISIVTDTGELGEKQIWQLSRSDLILLESNHDLQALKYSQRSDHLKNRIRENHLSNKQAGEILTKILNIRDKERIKSVLVGHLSGECNSPELIREWLRTWQQKNKSNIDFYLCPRDMASDYLEVSIDIVKPIQKYAGLIDW